MKIRYFSAHINAFPSAIAGVIVGAGSGADGCVTINNDMLLGLPVQREMEMYFANILEMASAK